MDPEHDRCYCSDCATRIPEVLEVSRPHGHAYEVPKGWCGFGFKADARASALKVFEEWAVSFHGCPSNRLPSILDNKGLLKPGDVCVAGWDQTSKPPDKGGGRRTGERPHRGLHVAEHQVLGA
jgi:hypothetical protein